MSENSRHLRLAAEAFKSAVTRLRNAANRTSMRITTEEAAAVVAVLLSDPEVHAMRLHGRRR